MKKRAGDQAIDGLLWFASVPVGLVVAALISGRPEPNQHLLRAFLSPLSAVWLAGYIAPRRQVAVGSVTGTLPLLILGYMLYEHPQYGPNASIVPILGWLAGFTILSTVEAKQRRLDIPLPPRYDQMQNQPPVIDCEKSRNIDEVSPVTQVRSAVTDSDHISKGCLTALAIYFLSFLGVYGTARVAKGMAPTYSKNHWEQIAFHYGAWFMAAVLVLLIGYYTVRLLSFRRHR